MNKVKFRAWNKIDKFMFYPITLDLNNNQDGEFYVGRVWYQRSQVSDDGYWLDLSEIELMQFTGLLDKNGKEIYEGDILGYPNKKIKKIVKLGDYCFNGGEYTERGIGFYLEKYENGRKESQESGIYGYPSIDDEIIGNIYETPNLLKGETK